MYKGVVGHFHDFGGLSFYISFYKAQRSIGTCCSSLQNTMWYTDSFHTVCGTLWCSGKAVSRSRGKALVQFPWAQSFMSLSKILYLHCLVLVSTQDNLSRMPAIFCQWSSVQFKITYCFSFYHFCSWSQSPHCLQEAVFSGWTTNLWLRSNFSPCTGTLQLTSCFKGWCTVLKSFLPVILMGHFYTPPHNSGGVLWFHVGRPWVRPSVVRPSIRPFFVSGW